MPIHWSRKFETGIPDIDREHRHLVDLINVLDAALEKPEPHILNRVFMQLGIRGRSRTEKWRAANFFAARH
ncbi:MAG: hypothetical protein Q8O25_09590 [Sulfurisoma sp.]|nr:hypothetical protein [Sulfurisoma sp.]